MYEVFSGMRALCLGQHMCKRFSVERVPRGFDLRSRQPLFINLRVVMPEAQSQSLCGRGLWNALWPS